VAILYGSTGGSRRRSPGRAASLRPHAFIAARRSFPPSLGIDPIGIARAAVHDVPRAASWRAARPSTSRSSSRASFAGADVARKIPESPGPPARCATVEGRDLESTSTRSTSDTTPAAGARHRRGVAAHFGKDASLSGSMSGRAGGHDPRPEPRYTRETARHHSSPADASSA